VGFGGVLLDLVNADRHLFDRGGHRRGGVALLAGAFGHLFGGGQQLVGRAGHLFGVVDDAGDHVAQVVLHGADVGQQAVLVVRVAIDRRRQVAAGDAPGDRRGDCRFAAQGADDVGRHQEGSDGDEGADGQPPEQQLDGVGTELGLDVVDVDAGTDHPAPGREALDEGNLGHPFLGTRLGPQVIDEAGALRLDDLVELDEQELAVLVLDLVQRLAFQFGLDRMHDHGVVQVVDPEIFDLVVAHGADCGGSAFLGFLDGNPAFAGLLFVVGQRGVGNLDQVAYLGLPVFHHLALAVDQQHGK